MLVEYYHPSFLPSFDDTKSNQTTTEVSVGSRMTINLAQDFIMGLTNFHSLLMRDILKSNCT